MTMATVNFLEVLAEAIAGKPQSVVRDMRKETAKGERAFIADLNKAFRQLGEDAAAAAEESGGLVLEVQESWAVWEEITEAKLSRHAQRRINEIVKKMNLERWKKDELAPIVGKHWRLTGDRVAKVLEGYDITGAGRGKMLELMIREGGKRAGLVDIDGDTKRALFNVINDAMQKGWGTRRVASAIEQYVPAGRFVHAGARYRSRMIARTEIVQAQGMASLDRYEKSPLVKRVVAFDGDGDTHCIARNGNKFTISQARQELASTHPNCVLTFGPDI